MYKGRGISLYTLIANYVVVNAKNIGLNEYEGHSLYDMVYSNKSVGRACETIFLER
ncbi:Tn3 family transposase [Photorhabdus sp. UCH-936]|nr:Tn3 family transposase [Photorhabdus antumapuensis]